MASAVNTGDISSKERRWMVVGVCLNKVLTPTLRKAVDKELQHWYNILSQPPDDIDKQVFPKYKKKQKFCYTIKTSMATMSTYRPVLMTIQ
jgi:tRNA A22 N-methylase